MFVGGNVRLGYWEVAASLFYNLFNKIKNINMVKTKSWHKKKKKKKNYGKKPNPGIIPPKFLWSFHHNFNEAWPTKKNFFDPKKKFF